MSESVTSWRTLGRVFSMRNCSFGHRDRSATSQGGFASPSVCGIALSGTMEYGDVSNLRKPYCVCRSRRLLARALPMYEV